MEAFLAFGFFDLAFLGFLSIGMSSLSGLLLSWRLPPTTALVLLRLFVDWRSWRESGTLLLSKFAFWLDYCLFSLVFSMS